VPEPLDTNSVPVVLTGIAVWVLAGLVLLVVRPDGHGWWLWTCLAGALCGVALLAYERWRRSRIADRIISEASTPGQAEANAGQAEASTPKRT
jgi:O-antigen/teichoic acid export membrane protein